jgi:hypothetical protein
MGSKLKPALAVLAHEIGVPGLSSIQELRDALLHGPKQEAGHTLVPLARSATHSLASQGIDALNASATRPGRERQVSHRMDLRGESPRGESLKSVSTEMSDDGPARLSSWDADTFHDSPTSDLQRGVSTISSTPSCTTAFSKSGTAMFWELRRKALVIAQHPSIWLRTPDP